MTNYMLARELAESSIVLLKNEDGLLPLKQGTCAAFFGRAQIETVLSGNGSGAVSAENATNILDACGNEGLQPVEELAAFYRQLDRRSDEDAPDWEDMAAMAKLVHSGIIYEYFGRYRPTPEEAAVPKQLIDRAKRQTDTAVYVLGRCAGGEECDRRLENDYYLSAAEKALIGQICEAFSRVVFILNVNGLIDLGWIEKFPSAKSVLFLGIPGEAGAEAAARILIGKTVPSGKLAVTIPRQYEDFPYAEHFSWDKEDLARIKTYGDYGLDAEENGSRGYRLSPVTVYQEGIYNGYRYFETFGIQPLYYFGHGLSYTSFSYGKPKIRKTESGMEVRVSITNTGGLAGREVAQLYIDTSRIQGDVPIRTLQGFSKTGRLLPGETENMCIFVPWRGFSYYDEKRSAWIIPQGSLGICLGGDIHHAERIAEISVPQEIMVEKCGTLPGIHPANAGKLDFMKRKNSGGSQREEQGSLVLLQDDVGYSDQKQPASGLRKSLPQQYVSQQPFPQHPDLSDFSVEELAALCVGYGPGIPFSAYGDTDAPCTIYGQDGNPLTVSDHKSGLPGYISPAMPGRGIHSVSYKDGPAGIGATAWPSEMLLACSFDENLCEHFGDAVGSECEAQGVDVWLAPAVNLHRHPLCGRNFEYFSEDPFLSGRLACAVTKGVQEKHSVLVCPKHFAANEQETFRRGSARLNVDAADSILTERTLRELYLLPFEMLVRQGGIHCVMTSFNKVNGVFSGGNEDLCTRLLRSEWGFEGVVVTDWGDMDTVVDGAEAVAAGNDIIMPGGPPVIRQILKGYGEGRVNREQLERAVKHLFCLLAFSGKI